MRKRPALIVDHRALRDNMQTVVGWCRDSGIDVAGVIKATTGMPSVALDYEQSGAKWIASSRLEQLARAKEAGVKLPLLMIRVPMLSELEEMVGICDYSLQSSTDTLRALEAAAEKAGKIHNVILMADLGDLREGFFEKDELVYAAKYVENVLPHLHLAGIGTNLGCVGSVMPTEEKMLMLADWAEAAEEAIGRPLEIVSGGATSSLMPVFDGVMPPKVNMLRIGAVQRRSLHTGGRSHRDKHQADPPDRAAGCERIRRESRLHRQGTPEARDTRDRPGRLRRHRRPDTPA